MMEKLVIRALLDRELSGYDIYKEMTAKGLTPRSNYLYTVLTTMRSRGLLKDRWVDGKRGPRKHLYSLNKKGENEFTVALGESVNVLMDGFIHANLGADDLSDHSNSIKSMFEHLRVPPPRNGAKFVIATPTFDPLLCYPIAFQVFSTTFPDASIYVVKPPGVRLQTKGTSNLTFLDGWRYDLPLKDGFADYLVLEGLPKDVSEEQEIRECLRVLRNDGHFVIRHPVVMTEEKKPKFTTFGEYASRLFYDFSEQDGLISVERAKSLVARYCEDMKSVESRGNVVIYGSGKNRE